MPKDMTTDARIEAVAGKPVELPNGGHFIANAEMTRAGMDLHLTSPDGHTVVVGGYFAQTPAPDLVTPDGARLSPAMVSAFLPPEHPGQYAASGQHANDASPAGKITEVVGEAHIIRADGTHVTATVGTPVYQGDVIETAKTGAVNILFVDNTTFAVSESARMSIDQFVYHSTEHSGSSFFSMLQGVFVYTSGLIGKTDPGSVSIETPVGSIGIRGTVVAGHILPAGQHSEITILDGAIALTNGSGTQEMNTSFSTVSLNSYQDQPTTVQMDSNTFSTSYSSLSGVAGDTLGHFSGPAAPAPAGSTAPADGSATPADTAPAPAGATAPAPAAAPTGATAPPPATAPDGTAAGTIAPPPAMATDGTALPPPPPPPSGSTFGDGSTGTFGPAPGSTFTAPAGGTMPGSGGGTAAAPPPSQSTGELPPPPSDTTAPNLPPAPMLGLADDTGIPGDRLTNNGHLNIGMLGPNATVEYTTDGANWIAGLPPVTWLDGSHTIQVRQTDAMGNVSHPSAPFTFTTDTTAATLGVMLVNDTGVGGNNIDLTTRDGHLSFTGLEPGAAVQYSSDNGATWSGLMAPSALPPGLVPGSNHLLVQQVDAAGNVSLTPASITFTLDNAPPMMTLAHTGGDLIAARTVTYTIQFNEPLAAMPTPSNFVNVALNPAAISSVTIAATANPNEYAVTVTTSTDGAMRLQVVGIHDVAGNLMAPFTDGALQPVILDTTAPAALGVVLTNDTGTAGGTTANNPTLHVTGVEAGATIQYKLDGGALQTVTLDGSGNFTLAGLSETAHTVVVQQTDAAGNNSPLSSSVGFTLDKTAPNVLTPSLAQDTGIGGNNADHLTSNSTVTLAGAITDTVQYSLNGGAWTPTNSAALVTLTAGLGDGHYDLQVRQIDAAGNSLPPATTLSFDVDKTAPGTLTPVLAHDTGIGGDNGDFNTSNSTVTLNGTITNMVQYSLNNGTTWSLPTSAADMTTFTAGLTDGHYDLQVRQVDAAGNFLTPTSTLSFDVDKSAPNVLTPSLLHDTSSGADNSDLLTKDGTVILSGAIEGGTTLVQYSMNGGAWATTTATTLQGQTALLTDGHYDLQIRQIDAAGNFLAPATTLSFEVDKTLPALLSGISASAGNTVVAGTPTSLSYTVTFSSDIDATTLTSADFSITGSAQPYVTIDSVNETTTRGVFTVGITAGAGTTFGETLTLQLNNGAVFSDMAGNATTISSATSSNTITVATSDFTPPTLLPTSFNDDRGAAPVIVGQTLHYTVAFSEDIAGLTLGNFTNAISPASGGASISIDGITVIGPGVFRVDVTPTSIGAIQLKLTSDGTSITDTSTNPLAAGTIIDSRAPIAVNPTLNFVPEYSHGTPGDTTDDGIRQFAAANTLIGTITNATGADHYAITLNGAPQHFWFNGTSFGSELVSAHPAPVFQIDNAGNITVNDPLALSHYLNPTGLNLTITAYDSSNVALATINPTIKILDYNGTTADIPQQLSAGNLSGTTSPSGDFLVHIGNTPSTIMGNGGLDVLIGGGGSDVIGVVNPNFTFVDGREGSDTLKIGGGGAGITMDFISGGVGKVANIENIALGSTGGGPGNHVMLNIQNVFDMTTPDGSGNHTLAFMAESGATQSILTLGGGGGGFALTGGIWGVSPMLQYSGTFTDAASVTHTVTLNVQQLMSPTDSLGMPGGVIVQDATHNMMPVFGATTILTGGGGADFLIAGSPTTTIAGGGGADILIGNASNNNLTILDNTFNLIDGGGSSDTLSLGNPTQNMFTVDFTGTTGIVRNIEKIDLGSSNTGGNHVILNLQNVFDMTGPTHTLTIGDISGTGSNGASVDIVMAGFTYDNINSTSGQLGTTVGDVIYTGTVSSNVVTLVIHETTATGTGHVAITQV